jgi:exosome complex component RRP42
MAAGDTRGFNVEARVVSNTNGSARVRVEGTDVLVGVKLVTVEPDKDTPESGKVLFMVDCSAGASASFVNRGGDQLANALTSALR